MANRPYPYYPAWDGKQTSAGITELVKLCAARWATKNLGTYVNRNMNNNAQPPLKSVHATGNVFDCQYKDEKQAFLIWQFLLANSKTLGISLVNWYAYGEYGATYKCSRGEGLAGVRVHQSDAESAGSWQGTPNWLHIEIDQVMAKDAAKFAKAWASCPYP